MNENDATQKQMYNKSDGLQGVPIMENMIDRRTFLSLTAGGSLASPKRRPPSSAGEARKV